MGETTGIGWTDHTFNPWWGCTEVSDGCDHCYAREWAAFTRKMEWGAGTPRIRTSQHNWNEPLRWNRKAAAAGRMDRVFCASMADVLDGEVDPAWRDDLWALIEQTPNLIWQLLTKRPENYRRMVPERILKLQRVWKGFTAEDSEMFARRWPAVRFLPGTRWVSYEPALGPLRLSYQSGPGLAPLPDWIICGGESGDEHRPFQEQWAHDVKNDCRKFGIAFYMKQMAGTTSKKAVAAVPKLLQIHEYPA